MKGERGCRPSVVESCRVHVAIGYFAWDVLNLFYALHCADLLSLCSSIKVGIIAAGYWEPKKWMPSDCLKQ